MVLKFFRAPHLLIAMNLTWQATSSFAATLPPQFHLSGLNRADLSAVDLHDIPVVIQFWASWCKSCNGVSQELSHLLKNHPKKVKYISISLDESKEAALAALKSHQISNLAADYFYDVDGAFARAVVDVSVPTVLLVNKDGVIVSRISGHFGSAQREEIRSKLVKISL